MLSEIGAGAQDEAALLEAFALHDRTLQLDEAALRRDPQNASYHRNYAGELIMIAYARELAGKDLEQAAEFSRRALEIDRALAAADPNNLEARQDLAYDHYLQGRAFQLTRDAKNAQDNYLKARAILKPLTRHILITSRLLSI